ncbi:MAG: PRC-barrel domain-containing protein [Pseudonocardiaceae bacterium]
MLFSEVRKCDVVSTATATKVARVDGFVVVPGPARVALLRLGKVAGEGALVSWEDLRGFGPDAATVADVAVIRTARDGFERRAETRELDILGKRVLTDRGDALGEITDVDFDLESGAVTTLLTRKEAIAGERLIGHGRYAVVVSA